jgi:RNA polymerase-binding protein DksA
MLKKNANKLSAGEKKYYRELLLKKKQAILDEIERISADAKLSPKEASGDISAYTLHMADVATDAYDREFSLGLASNGRRVIQIIDEAIKRIDEGTFGLCQDCGAKIGKARLKALPYAWLCIKCQEKVEKKD